MITYKYVVSDKQGLHATNAMSLSRRPLNMRARITLKSQKGTADCKNVLALMSLGAHQGESLELTVEGPDEGQASGFLKGSCALFYKHALTGGHDEINPFPNS